MDFLMDRWVGRRRCFLLLSTNWHGGMRVGSWVNGIGEENLPIWLTINPLPGRPTSDDGR